MKRYVNAGADNLAVSDDADQVAFTLRGDLYVTSTKYKTTRRITDTPGQERTFCFAPDGRTVYTSDEALRGQSVTLPTGIYIIAADGFRPARLVRR